MSNLPRAARFLFLTLCTLSLAAPESADPGWPRKYTGGQVSLVLYQPQVDEWKDFKSLKARCAVALTVSKNAQPVWGVLSMESGTVVDPEARTVTFVGFRVTDVHFPAAKDESQAGQWKALATKLLPANPTTMAIERVLAYMDRQPVSTRQTAVLLEPPAILVSPQPAALVIIDGEPVPVGIDGTSLQKIVNTNWDLFYDKKESRYYLRDGNVWLSAKSLGDAWPATLKLPKDFTKLPATAQYQDVRHAAAKPHKPSGVKLVLVVNKPSELIVIVGNPALQPIQNTNLMWVTNTECDLFFDNKDKHYYFLTSGRWFRSSELKSQTWVAATNALPEDFKKISPGHPRAHVLAAVPGTHQAEEAVLNASIPETATIDRKSIKAEVKYVGDPRFEQIANTQVSYAANTPNDVLRFEDRYYLCLNGVWLVSAAANGPWQAADEIPDEIYKIPPSSPKYNVTYVTIYNSTPDTVIYGYTAGYTGIYVGHGVAMWGTGYYYPPYYSVGNGPLPVYWPCPYYTYGSSAWYNPATGTYLRGSARYGPFGGYARAAAYNPATGAYDWGRTVWGPYGPAASDHAANAYLSWGRSVVDKPKPAARALAAKSSAGDVYAGTDGNAYKRNQSGQWSPAESHAPRPAAPPDQSVQNGLNHDASARAMGNYDTQWSEASRKGSGWSTYSWVNRGSTGWGVRTPGF